MKVLASLRLNWIWRPWLLATIVYLLITVIVTYPVISQLNTHIAGESTGDALEFVWSMWWWKYALIDIQQNPLNINVINYPHGMYFPLLPLMSQVFVLALPLTALTSPIFSYNIVFLLSFVLSGLSGYILCTELSGDSRAGFIGGLIWAFYPNKTGHALGGHLFFTFMFIFPLVAWSVLRLLREATTRRAIIAGLMLALSSTLHPIYLVYFIAIFMMVIIGHGIWVKGPAFWKFNRTRALAIALGVMVILVTPLLIPTISHTLKGNLTFLAERGATGFAFDVLAYLLPAPNNPLILRTPLTDLAQRVVLSEYESIAYLGWVPLILSIIGARTRWQEGKIWVVLAVIAGILALGPLLKIGGHLVRVPVEDDYYPIVMPYAYIGRLPFFKWSRTPGRLDVLVMLSIAVLSAFGFKQVSSWSVWEAKSRFSLLFFISLSILLGYLVKYPFPTIPAKVPESLLELRDNMSDLAVLNLPMSNDSDNLKSIYLQTIHQRPIVGGRVYRDIPGGLRLHSFLSQLLISPMHKDIIPTPTNESRYEVLNALEIGWVLYDALADRESTARSSLRSRLGDPVETTDEIDVFSVPSIDLGSDILVWTLGDGWYPIQDWGEKLGRWFNHRGVVYIFSGHERSGRLSFTAIPGQKLSHLKVLVNGVSVGHFVVGDWMEYHTQPIQLQSGINVVELIDERGSQIYVGDPRCAGGSPISGPYPVQPPCDPADRTARELSLAISNLRLIPRDENLSFTSAGIQFGDAIELVGFNTSPKVKPGKCLDLHLVWRATAHPAKDFTVFIHLLNKNGELVAQDDAQPISGLYPTTHWQTGQIVTYNVPILIPTDADPGTYSLRMGFYHWPSMDRLPVSGTSQVKDNTFLITDIEVKP